MVKGIKANRWIPGTLKMTDQVFGAELCDKRWFGFEIEHLLMARLFRIQYQNQYLCLLEIVTDTDINIAQWVIFEF